MGAEPLVVVYQVTNAANGKRYIGYTGRGLVNRKRGHLRDAAAGKGHALHRAIRKYGPENFTFHVLGDFGDDEDLAKVYEVETIAKYKPEYNLSYGGDGGTLHKTSREKIGAANRGRKMPPSHSEKRRAYLTGKKHTLETRAKMSAVQKGHPPTRTGPIPEGVRLKISAANKGQVPWIAGKKHTEVTRAKMSAWQRGRVLPDEHRKSISEARRRAWAANREGYLSAVREAVKAGQEARKIRVKCLDDGCVFAGCSDADRHYGFRVGTVSRVLKGTIKNRTGMTFAYDGA